MAAARGRCVKVILETCLLTPEQIVRACELSVEAGATFVKTSTGFSTGGATVEDVALMRKTVGDRCKVKASGGIHNAAEAQPMVDACADLIGTSSGIAIVDALLPETLSPQAEYLLASETMNAGCVLLSRAQLAAPAQCAAAAAHLERALEAAKSSRRFAPGEILAKDWDALTDADLAALAACGYRQASCEKLHFDQHAAFTSLCFLELHLTPEQLQAAAQRLFAAPECGRVLRVKGFAPAPAGGWLELNATAAGCTLAPIPQGQEVVIVIGEGLDKAAIEAKLKGYEN